MTTISKPEQVFDVRLVDRHVVTGVTTKKDHDQYLKQLPDVSDNMEEIPKDAIFDLPEEDGE